MTDLTVLPAANSADADVARLAALVCEAPWAFVARAGPIKWSVTGAVGLSLEFLRGSDPICSRVGELLDVPDLLQDPWLRMSPLVTGPVQLRCLAATPVRVQGRIAGIIAAGGPEPRALLARGKYQSLLDLASMLSRSWPAPALPLTESTDRTFRHLIDRLPEALFIQRDGRVLYVNAQCAELFRRPTTSIVGLPLRELVTPEALPKLVGALRAIELDGRTELTHETTLRRPDGTMTDAELRVVRVLFEGSLAHACLVRDLSERRSMQTRLLLADRMASVGTLAAGAAHEINNPLAFIIINVAYASEQLERFAATGANIDGLPLSDILEALSEAHVGGQRVRDIVRDLRTFSSADRAKREAVQLRDVLNTCINMAKNEIRHRAKLERDFHDVPAIQANAAQLAQVFLNLIVNAAQSMGSGHADQNLIRVSLRSGGEHSVQVSISDTGSGIAPELVGRIFDPFFTTKPVGVGTGLGLAVCHNIVSSLGGTISVESAPKKGSTFTVELPVQPPEQPQVPERPVSLAPLRRGRVLVIDDEPSVGNALRRGLRSSYEVDAVLSAREALEKLALHKTYDVILCDVMMPDMSGMEFYSELQRGFGGLIDRLVFISGGAFVEEAQLFLESIPNRRVEKPLDLNQVKNLLQEVMEQGRPVVAE